jgi:NAD(P)-dependent dehydrogenase (short-subunit alcohol dehydrogenase family)
MYNGSECAKLEGTRTARAAAPLAPPTMIATRGRRAGTVGETEQVARTYAYLIDQPFSTGTVVAVDGGTLLV